MTAVAVAPVVADVSMVVGTASASTEAAGTASASTQAAGTGQAAPPPVPGPASVCSDLPPSLAEAVEALSGALDVLLGADLGKLPGRGAEHVVLALHRAAERSAAGVTTGLPRLERDGWWALDDEATFPRWVARRLGMAVPAARRRVRVGRALADHLPQAAAAARSGAVSTEAVAVLAGAVTSDARREVLADPDHGCNEAFLLAQAAALPVDDLRSVLRVWSHRADPASDERGFREADEREHLSLSRLPFGYRVDGQLTVEHGQQLSAALAAVSPVPAADDTRSAAQRRAHALADLARTVLEHHPVGAGRVARPGIMVHVDHATLAGLVAESCDTGTLGEGAGRRGGPRSGGEGGSQGAPWLAPQPFGPDDLRRGAFFEDGTSVPRAVLDRLACDGGLSRILFGPDGAVLDVGRTQRIFAGPVRAAVVARDGHCAYPGCSAPPHLGEVHHVAHWVRDGGRTEPANGVLLCYHHHEVVHRRGLAFARSGRGWAFEDRFGTVLRR